MTSILREICDKKNEFVAARRTITPESTLIERLGIEPRAPRGFIKFIDVKKVEAKPALIAEIKKASPSGGIIRPDFQPAELARDYESGGASCLSVLTDEPYFQGCDEYLVAARRACTLPCLRKDFVVDRYQIYESALLGADCILLIMAALDDAQAKDFYMLAREVGLDVLVEIHDAAELDRALAFNPAMVGVNNRNLKTLHVDVQTSFTLLPRIPAGVIRVAESGISDPATLSSLHRAGYDAFLVGESLMRQKDLKSATARLLGN